MTLLMTLHSQQQRSVHTAAYTRCKRHIALIAGAILAITHTHTHTPHTNIHPTHLRGVFCLTPRLCNSVMDLGYSVRCVILSCGSKGGEISGTYNVLPASVAGCWVVAAPRTALLNHPVWHKQLRYRPTCPHFTQQALLGSGYSVTL